MKRDHTIEGTMAHAQRAAVLSALCATNNNLSQAARHLRIGRTTLYRLLNEYEVSLDKPSGRRTVASRRATSDTHAPRVRLVDGVWYLEGVQSSSSAYR